MDIEKYFSKFFNGTKDPSLEAMRYFMNEFGNPHLDLKFIHIAGTNGKGSVTEMLSSVLIQSGYKVGKFMSPHLIKYNERTSINNENISDEDLEEIIEYLKPKIQEYNDCHDTKVSLFELETTIAILYFYYKEVDIVIFEVGLGGLYDCTNIIEKPIASIINTISYDHMNILGNTLEEIAVEKVGIIKENSNTIFCSQGNLVDNIVKEKCKQKNNYLNMLKLDDVQNYSYNNDYQEFDYKNYKNIKINLKGPKQVKNAMLCLECFDEINQNGFKVKLDDIKKGIKIVKHRARFETLQESPRMIFDGAHNDSAIKNFRDTVNMYYKNESKVYIISLLNTKDYKSYLKEILKEENSKFVFTSGNDTDRFFSKEELYNEACKIISNDFGRQSKQLYKMELEQAIEMYKMKYEYVETKKVNEEIVFIIGSFYVYKTVIHILEEK